MSYPMNFSLRGLLLTVFLLVFALAGCGPQPAAPPPAVTNSVQPTQPVSDDTGLCSAEPVAEPTCEAVLVVDEDAPVLITGAFTYSNDIVLERYYVEHSVGLIDMTGFVLRDKEWILPVESQVLGYLDVDTENKTGTFHLQLPAQPQGVLNDVDQDDQADPGVQVFTLGYMGNLTGGPFSVGDDRSEGWPGYLTSTRLDSEADDEVTGGQLIVWAPDTDQEFPTGFGADGLLFSADDPVGPIPAGYSVVDLDQQPFAIIRQPEIEMTLHEPDDLAVKDFSALSYTEAFEQMFTQVRKEYAFNGIEGKQPEWDSVYAELAPRVADAEQKRDGEAFFRVLQDFTYAFQDGHVGIQSEKYGDLVWQPASGGYGLSIRELDDDRVIAAFVLPGGPAALAGIQPGAVITAVNDTPVEEAIAEVEPISAPHSTTFAFRFEQARFLMRAAPGTTTTVTFANPGQTERTVTLTAVDETYSYIATAQYFSYNPYAVPVEYGFLQSGIGYVRVNANNDDLNLTVRLFERALKTFADNQAEGLIIDMRKNNGGAPLGLAGFLTDQEIPMGQLEYYNEQTGRFEPEGDISKVRPNEKQYSFPKMALLVDQTCYSACELEAYAFSQVPGMQVIGQYPTAGVEAEVARGQFKMPEEITVRVPTGRFVLPDGSIFLEGTGVVPDLRIPVDAESVLAQNDYVLRKAEQVLLGNN